MIATADGQNARVVIGSSRDGRKIAVTHVITSLTTGGAEMMLLKLIRAMDPASIGSSVIGLLGDGAVGSMMRESGISVESLDLSPARAAGGLWKLGRALRRRRPQIVQTWMYHADLFGTLASVSVPGTPVLWNIRCGRPDPTVHKRSTYWIARACAAASPFLPARIVCCSQSALEAHAAAGYAASKMQVIPNGFDTGEFAPQPQFRALVRRELGLAPEAILAGMIGRFDAAKDHFNFCKAAALASRENPLLHFVLCGPDVSESNPVLTRWISEAGIAGRCRLLGLRRDMPRILSALDMLVSSSVLEGFPNVLGEAMACALPCVATESGDSRLILGDTGYVVPVRDPEALAAGILALTNAGAELRRSMGEAARARVVEKFSLAAAASEYEKTYREVASRCAA